MRRIFASDIPAWADMFDVLPVAVIATDAPGVVTHWNPHAERLFGWRKPETVGHNIREFTVGPEEAQLAEEIMARVVAGDAWEGEFAAQRKDGSKILISVVDAPLFDEGGDVVGIIGVSVEVTRFLEVERRETLEALEAAMQRISEFAMRRMGLFVDGASAEGHDSHPELDALTARQRQIVALLGRGLRVGMIAERLGVSESTVRNHLGVVYRRLGVHSQRELLELLAGPPGF